MLHRTNMISRVALRIAIAAAALPAAPAWAQTIGKSVCTTREAAAALTRMVPVQMPARAALEGPNRSAIVQIDLDERGVARNAKVVTSSGYALLDTAARQAALEQSYAPQIRDCEHVSGAYRVVVDFTDGAQ